MMEHSGEHAPYTIVHTSPASTGGLPTAWGGGHYTTKFPGESWPEGGAESAPTPCEPETEGGKQPKETMRRAPPGVSNMGESGGLTVQSLRGEPETDDMTAGALTPLVVWNPRDTGALTSLGWFVRRVCVNSSGTRALTSARFVRRSVCENPERKASRGSDITRFFRRSVCANLEGKVGL